MTEYITQEEAQKLWTQTCGNAHDLCNAAIVAYLAQGEPVAIRYDFDGYGWKYIDNGSGSNWRERVTHLDAENLYTHPPEPNARLVEKAQAVVDRWDTPLWKDVPATAVYINELRDALAQH